MFFSEDILAQIVRSIEKDSKLCCTEEIALAVYLGEQRKQEFHPHEPRIKCFVLEDNNASLLKPGQLGNILPPNSLKIFFQQLQNKEITTGLRFQIIINCFHHRMLLDLQKKQDGWSVVFFTGARYEGAIDMIGDFTNATKLKQFLGNGKHHVVIIDGETQTDHTSCSIFALDAAHRVASIPNFHDTFAGMRSLMRLAGENLLRAHDPAMQKVAAMFFRNVQNYHVIELIPQEIMEQRLNPENRVQVKTLATHFHDHTVTSEGKVWNHSIDHKSDKYCRLILQAIDDGRITIENLAHILEQESGQEFLKSLPPKQQSATCCTIL